MRIGVALPASGPHASARFVRDIALRCESLGYDSLWISDHLSWSPHHAAARYPGWAAGRAPAELQPNQYEPVATLAYLAGCTSRIRLGTAVLVLPVRNPVVLAKQLASLDDLSGGRLTLGVGVGSTIHAEADFGAVGAQGLKAHRGRATDEWIEVIRRVWSEPACTYRGDLIDIDEAWVFPKPAQAGGPPILVGGDSERALERVARLGDGSVASRLGPGEVAGRRSELAARGRRYGRSETHFYLMVSRWLSLDDDEGVAVARADRALSGVTRGGRPIAGQRDNLIGTPGRLREIVDAYRRAGADEIMVQPVGETEAEIVEGLHRFSDDVLRGLGLPTPSRVGGR